MKIIQRYGAGKLAVQPPDISLIYLGLVFYSLISLFFFNNTNIQEFDALDVHSMITLLKSPQMIS